MPNGLIFLVVVAIWAAYFVQYWIRRRDHLATARSMDRFSESMRVLARRSPLPQSSLETPAARSYAVSPGRAMRPQVLVKRADVTASTSIMANHVAGEVDSPLAGTEAGPRAGLGPGTGTGTGTGVGPAPRPVSAGHAAYDSSPVRTGRPARPAAAGSRSSGAPRRLRGLVLLGQLVALLVVTVLAVFGAVVWWAPLLAIVAIGCAVVWVREWVRADRAMRMTQGRNAAQRSAPARTAPRPARRPARPAGPAAVPTPGAADDSTSTSTATSTAVRAEAEREVAATEVVEPYGFEDPAPATAPAPAASTATAAQAAGALAAAVLVDEDDIPLTWDPRPVPRPTYTMKARADRPLPPPAAVTPTPVGVDEDDDVRAVEPQRHTG